jgi:hypothetical protein
VPRHGADNPSQPHWTGSIHQRLSLDNLSIQPPDIDTATDIIRKLLAFTQSESLLMRRLAIGEPTEIVVRRPTLIQPASSNVPSNFNETVHVHRNPMRRS